MTRKISDHPNKFFSHEEKQRMIKAIQAAEKKTSGEIRLHLERKSAKEPFRRAVEIFEKIGMHRTAQRNGVLIYLATADRKFSVLGDEGIDRVVPEDFWDSIVEELKNHFQRGKFCDGICSAVHRIGEKLKNFFPYQDDDKNELPDDISIRD